MSSHTSSSFRPGGRQQREIVASRSSRLLMRQVSALGLEDPAFGESGRNRNPNSSPRQHPSHIFEDMDLNDLPPDMREEESIASDPTAVVIVDKSLLMDMPDDSSITKQSSVGGRPSDSSTKSHSKMSTTGGSTTPSTAPSRASFFPSRSSCHQLQSPRQTQRTSKSCRSTATGARSSARCSNQSLIAEAAQAMVVSGVSCADPIVMEAMGQAERESDNSQVYHNQMMMDCGASSNRRRQSFCSYVPPLGHDAGPIHMDQDDSCSRSRALPDFDNIFPQQTHQQQPQRYLQSPAGRSSVKSNVSRRSVPNIFIFEADDCSAANSAANSATRSMSSSPWRAPAPWNDEVAPSIFFNKSEGPSRPLTSPRRRPTHDADPQEREQAPPRPRTASMEQAPKEENGEDDLEPEELEQLRNELAELEAALSMR